jgi:hypothetical protein
VADSFDNARMCSAPAYISLQKLNNICRTGIGIGLQQAYAAHNHSRSAVRALKRSRIQKRLLDGMQAAIFLKALDGDSWFSGGRADGNLARTPRRSAE